MSLRDKYTDEEWDELEKSINAVETLTVKITEDDIQKLIRDKIFAFRKKHITQSDIKFTVIEKKIGSYPLNNFEEEDVMGFSHIESTIKINK